MANACGRAIAQADSRVFFATEARIRAQGGPCGICDGQSSTGISFFCD
jgi:hypothetical protein